MLGKFAVIYLVLIILSWGGYSKSAIIAASNAASNAGSFEDKAKETYKRVISCLKDRATKTIPANFSWESLEYPLDAEQHYEELLDKTLKYRSNIKPHSYSGYSESWIENRFIDQFASLPFETFGGLIPLFVQWTDIHVHHITKVTKATKTRFPMGNLPQNTFVTLHQSILDVLRPTVLYVALSQDDQGLFQLSTLAPNILSISGGGYGNIPIPLIKGTIDAQPIDDHIATTHTIARDNGHNSTSSWNHFIGFYGNVRPALARSRLLQSFAEVMKQNLKYSNQKVLYHYMGKEWISKISSTMFNLAPRGFGRSSFRLAEIIQIGRIPVYLYDDVPWLPYEGTDISLNKFGYVAGPKDYQHIVKTLEVHSKNATEMTKRFLLVQEIRKHYTYEGVMEQLTSFFSDPFGSNGGQLRCSRLPNKDH